MNDKKARNPKSEARNKSQIRNRFLAFFAIFCSIFLLLSTALAQTNLTAQVEDVPAQLNYNADGSVTVSFKGSAGTVYRIYCSDSAAASPDTMNWKLAADNLTAENAAWTTWVDKGDTGRSSPADVQQRYYRVVTKGLLLGDTPPPLSPSSTTFTGLTKSLRLARLQEAADAARMLRALADGDCMTAINILRRYGVADATLADMTKRICQPTQRVPLGDSFLRAMFSMPIAGTKNEVQQRLGASANRGYDRAGWLAFGLGPEWQKSCDEQSSRFLTAPIGVLDLQLQEPNAIQIFKWYDRYASKLHSVSVNWDGLSNFDLKNNYQDADLVMSGFYKLIKARNPNAFVWVRVVWQEDDSDARWLQALSFKPDGLICWNLHSFASPFERARNKYVAIVGEDTPMIVADFFGYWPQVQLTNDPAALGQLIGPNLGRMETKLQAMGYRGLGVEWQTVNTIANGKNN